MSYLQSERETTDEFVNRARRKGNLCKFWAGELDERIIELIITTTLIQALQKHLLDQDKGYRVDLLLIEARKYEAMAAGRETLQILKSTRHMVTDEIRQRQLCQKCALTHQPRRCPSYRDICNFCNGKRHWAKYCRKKHWQKEDNHPRRDRRSENMSESRGRRGRKPHKPIHEGRLRLSYASNSRNPRATRVPIEQPRSLEHVTIFDLD